MRCISRFVVLHCLFTATNNLKLDCAKSKEIIIEFMMTKAHNILSKVNNMNSFMHKSEMTTEKQA